MRRRPAGGLEQEVLAVLAAAQRPLTPSEVLAGLETGLAYTTVLTTLSRLYGKGAVERERVGRAYAYRFAADQHTLVARRMRRLLDGDQDRADVLARFVAELAPDDERLLQRLLREGEPGPDQPDRRGA